MKYLTVLLLIFVSGCMYVNVPGKFQAFTLFKDIDLQEIYLEDPNSVAWLSDYESDAADAKFKYNPLTGSVEVAVEGEKDADD